MIFLLPRSLSFSSLRITWFRLRQRNFTVSPANKRHIDFTRGWSPEIVVCFNGRAPLFGDPKLTRGDPVRFFSALHTAVSLIVSPLFPSSYCCPPFLRSLFFSSLTLLFFASSLLSLYLSLSFALLLRLNGVAARIRRHIVAPAFLERPILISRARNSRTLCVLARGSLNAGMPVFLSRAFAAHPTRPLPLWRPVARGRTLAAFISATTKEEISRGENRVFVASLKNRLV